MKTKSVLGMLETNFKTWCSLNNTPIPNGPLNPPMAERVEAVLEQTEMVKSRASKMGVDDFLKLLSSFNAVGIHFR